MRNISDTICSEKKKKNTHILFSNFFSENRAVYEMMSKYMAEPEWQQRIWLMRFACWKSRATHAQTHAHARTLTPTPTHACTPARARTYTHIHVTLIAFPQQQWFRERARMFRYAYIACLIWI